MRICLMIEGQEGVAWADWVALARGVRAARLRRAVPLRPLPERRRPRRARLARRLGDGHRARALTTTLRLGTLVSPATFRHPSALAKAVVTADHVSGGRVELGIGTGWLEEEHTAYGFPFPPMGERMAVLSEQLEIIHRQWTEHTFDFTGKHYRIEGLDALPKPIQRPHPPLIIGGAAGPRIARASPRAGPTSTTRSTSRPTRPRERRRALDRACEEEGRDPGTLRFSMMNGFLVGADRDDLRARAHRLAEWRGHTDQANADIDNYIAAVAQPWIVGTPEEIVARLREYESAGVEAVMLQHHLFQDFDALELIGREVIPAIGT